MKQKDLKKISVDVSNECWKRLKIISVHRETTLSELVKEILEKSVLSKKLNVDVPEMEGL